MKKLTIVCAVLVLVPLMCTVAASSQKTNEKETKDAFSLRDFVLSVSDAATTGGIDAALELFDTVPEEEKQNKDLMYMHASLLLSAGKAKDAEKLATTLLDSSPRDTDVLFLNAMIAKAQNSKNKKSQYLKQIVSIDPNNAEANAELGNEYMQSKGYKQAKQYFLRSMTSDATYTTAIFGYGQACYYLGDFKDAANAFNRILSLNPTEDIAWSYLAKVEAETGGYATAAEYVQKAIDLNPTYYNYWIDYGDYMRYQGNTDDSIAAFTKAISINPDYFLGYVYRAGLYEQNNEFELALDDYKSIVRTNPQYTYAYESIGLLAWHTEDWVACRDAYTKALAQDKDNVSYALMIAACLKKENKKQEVKSFIDKQIRNMDRGTPEYAVLRLYIDGLGDSNALQKVRSIESKNQRGKLLYYMAVYYAINKADELAKEIFIEICNMNTPMFFEYRLAEWALEKYNVSIPSKTGLVPKRK